MKEVKKPIASRIKNWEESDEEEENKILVQTKDFKFLKFIKNSVKPKENNLNWQ